MKSMTGFGRAEVSLDTHDAVVEISSVNRRNLEIGLSLPREWQNLDSEVQPRLRKKINRGRVNFSLKVNRPHGLGLSSWDEYAVSETLANLRKLAEQVNVPFDPDPTLLYRVAISQGEGSLPDWQEHQNLLFQMVDSALDNFIAMREKEGAAIFTDMQERLNSLVSIVERVEPLVSRQVPLYRETLYKRLSDAGLDVNLDDERVLREIALFAEKCDVSEELTRLRSHLGQMEETFQENGAIGRKLEFILQEIFREFNTLANKSSDIEIVRAVLDAKVEVEKLREQSLNVE